VHVYGSSWGSPLLFCLLPATVYSTSLTFCFTLSVSIYCFSYKSRIQCSWVSSGFSLCCYLSLLFLTLLLSMSHEPYTILFQICGDVRKCSVSLINHQWSPFMFTNVPVFSVVKIGFKVLEEQTTKDTIWELWLQSRGGIGDVYSYIFKIWKEIIRINWWLIVHRKYRKGRNS
jgi:hypothetical protein